MLGEIYRWIWRAGLLGLAVGGFVPLAASPKNRPYEIATWPRGPVFIDGPQSS
jgi:hypothetical protein